MQPHYSRRTQGARFPITCGNSALESKRVADSDSHLWEMCHTTSCRHRARRHSGIVAQGHRLGRENAAEKRIADDFTALPNHEYPDMSEI